MFVIQVSPCPEMMAPRVGGAVKRKAATTVSGCVAFSGNKHSEGHSEKRLETIGPGYRQEVLRWYLDFVRFQGMDADNVSRNRARITS